MLLLKLYRYGISTNNLFIMRRIISNMLFGFCFCFSALCLAKDQDSLVKDTNIVWERTSTELERSETFKVKSIIVPAVFISYGFISFLGNNELKHLDLNTRDELQEDHPLFAAHAD